MKVVKIVRATEGNEVAAAQEIENFYNEMAKEGARTSRAIITSAGSDVVYTIYADKPDPVDKDDQDDINDDDDAIDESDFLS